jgi:ABC-2 type transport system ATP-binding protein
MSAPAIADLASANHIAIYELAPQSASLEDIYMKLTHDSVEYRSGATTTDIPTDSQTSTPKAA